MKVGQEPEGFNLPAQLPRPFPTGWVVAGGLALSGVLIVATGKIQGGGKPPASAPEELLISRNVPVTISMGGDGAVDMLDATTLPFQLDLALKDCEPDAVEAITDDPIETRRSTTLKLVNAMIRSETETLKIPDEIEVACDSVSTEFPETVRIHNVTLEGIAGHLPRTEEKIRDWTTFTRSSSGFMDYRQETNVPGFRTLQVRFEEAIPPQTS